MIYQTLLNVGEIQRRAKELNCVSVAFEKSYNRVPREDIMAWLYEGIWGGREVCESAGLQVEEM